MVEFALAGGINFKDALKVHGDFLNRIGRRPLLGCTIGALWIALPGVADGEKATIVFSSDGKRGRYGSPFVWSKKAKDLAVTPAPVKKKDGLSNTEGFKFFFDAPCTGGCCEYRYPDGVVLSLGYSADKLPYLGIWINHYDFHDLCNVAFEPSSGTFDRPDAARIRGQFSTLKPYGSYDWNIGFTVRRD
jgi:hypothetical protein